MDVLFNSLCGTTPGGCDTAGVWLGALLTLLVFSYLVRDTFLFRLAQALLVGSAIGYGSAVILRTVLWDQLLGPLLADSGNVWAHTWPLFFPLALGVLLLTKLVPSWSPAGNISLGFLFGVGGALAIGGALSGALAPQLSASAVSLAPNVGLTNWINGLLIAVGSLGALLAFRFTTGHAARPLRLYSALAAAWGRVGRAFIMVAFGAIFANVLTARVSTLVGQLYFLMHNWLGVIK
jgi:hypothetical protein